MAFPDAACLLEEICWLEEMSAHLIADTGDGEVPQVPQPVASAVQDPNVEETFVQLCHFLIGIPSLCLDSASRHLASPRYCCLACCIP